MSGRTGWSEQATYRQKVGDGPKGETPVREGWGGEGVRIVRRWPLPWLLDAELLAQPDYRFIELRPVLWE